MSDETLFAASRRIFLQGLAGTGAASDDRAPPKQHPPSIPTEITALNQIRQSVNGCVWGALRTFDAGFSIRPIKNLTIAGSVLNLTNDYGRSTDIPQSFNYWDSGNPAMLGRRFSLSVSYSTD